MADTPAKTDVTVPATRDTTHEMLVALLVFVMTGILLIEIGGISNQSGNVIIALLAIMLTVQAITRVNPFVEFFEHHPLTPKQGK